MGKARISVAAFLVLMALFCVNDAMVRAQVQSSSSSAQNDHASDTAAIEKIVHGNPSLCGGR